MLARIFGLALGLFFCVSAHAGAWLQPVGQGLVITQATYYTSDQYFDADGRTRGQPRFSKFELQPYAEYGIHRSLTIGGSLYAQRVEQSGRNNRGIADPELFARTSLWRDERNVLSLQPLLKLPSQFRRDASPRGGSKSTDVELSLLYGRNQPIFTPSDYVDFRLGYRARNQGLSDQLRVDITGGIKQSERFEFTLSARGTIATNPTDADAFTENGELDYSLLKAELGGMYYLNDDRWLQATVFEHLFGVQTGSGYGVSLGFGQRF